MAGLALFGGGGGSGGRLGVAAAGYSGGGFGRAAAVAALFCAGDLGFACTQLGCGLCGGGGSSGAGAGQPTALLSGVFLSYATVLLSCVLALLSRAHGAERARARGRPREGAPRRRDAEGDVGALQRLADAGRRALAEQRERAPVPPPQQAELPGARHSRTRAPHGWVCALCLACCY